MTSPSTGDRAESVDEGQARPPSPPASSDLGKFSDSLAEPVAALIRGATIALPNALLGAFLAATTSFDPLTASGIGVLSLLAGMTGIWWVYERTRSIADPLVATIRLVSMGGQILRRLAVALLLAGVFVFLVIRAEALGDWSLILVGAATVAYSYTLSSALAWVAVQQRLIKQAAQFQYPDYVTTNEERVRFRRAIDALGRMDMNLPTYVRREFEPENVQRARLQEFWERRRAAWTDVAWSTIPELGVVTLIYPEGKCIVVAIPPNLSFEAAVALMGELAIRKPEYVKFYGALLPAEVRMDVRQALEPWWFRVEDGETEIRPGSRWVDEESAASDAAAVENVGA